MKKLIILFIGISFFLPGCVYAFRYDGPYKGKVIDIITGEPIEGAVVLGVWETVAIGPAGGVHSYYDAKETLTDKNGEFEISGKGLRILSNLEPMTAYIFKAGYSDEAIDWTDLFKRLHEEIKWEGNKAIIPLKKLTMEERKRHSPPEPPSEAPFEKVRFMLKEIEKDDIERGLPPRKIWKGHKIE